MKLKYPKILLFLFVFFFIFSFIWASATIYYPSKPPMELESAEKFDVHYALSLKLPFIFKYYLYKPYKYDNKKNYPLVTMLHGSSRHMNGAIYASSYKVQKQHPMFVLVPVAPPLTIWASPKSLKPQSYSLAKLSIDKVVKKYPIDKNRLYITGYSMGGAGTFGMIYHYYDLFAAAASLCGYWSDNLDDYKEMAKARTSIKIHHGKMDQYVDYQRSKSAYYSLRTLNVDAELISYKHMNHNIWDKIYSDMDFWDWLNQQSKF